MAVASDKALDLKLLILFRRDIGQVYYKSALLGPVSNFYYFYPCVDCFDFFLLEFVDKTISELRCRLECFIVRRGILLFHEGLVNQSLSVLGWVLCLIRYYVF